MIDTHTHIYMPDSFAEDSTETVRRALASGVRRMVFPAVDLPTFGPLLDLHASFPESTAVAVGLHPTELSSDWSTDLEEIRRMALEAKAHIVAVGETGMDLYWDKSNLEAQKEAFMVQLVMGMEMNLPVIIHCREALEETLQVISSFKQKYPDKLPRLIFHSFTGTSADVKRIREVCDPMFGINGVVTFKNARELPEAVMEIGLDRLLLETDSPYLAPVPKRGRRNESSYLPFIRDKISAIMGLEPEEIERHTDANSEKVFKF